MNHSKTVRPLPNKEPERPHLTRHLIGDERPLTATSGVRRQALNLFHVEDKVTPEGS